MFLTRKLSTRNHERKDSPLSAASRPRSLPTIAASCDLYFNESVSDCSLSTRFSFLSASCSFIASASWRWSVCTCSCSFSCRRISSSNFFCSPSNYDQNRRGKKVNPFSRSFRNDIRFDIDCCQFIRLFYLRGELKLSVLESFLRCDDKFILSFLIKLLGWSKSNCVYFHVRVYKWKMNFPRENFVRRGTLSHLFLLPSFRQLCDSVLKGFHLFR